MICLHFVLGELPTLGIYNTDTSREMTDYRETNYQCRQV